MNGTVRTPTSFSVEDTAEGLRITMPSPRAMPLVVFLAVWLTGWTFGGIEAIRVLARADTLLHPVSLFLLLWLTGWVLGEVGVAAFLAFMLNGAEIVTVSSAAVSLRVEAFGYGFTRVHDLAHVSNLRPVSGSDSSSREFLAFDFAERTVRFGTNLNETRAAEIAEEIWRRFESLRPLYAEKPGESADQL